MNWKGYHILDIMVSSKEKNKNNGTSQDNGEVSYLFIRSSLDKSSNAIMSERACKNKIGCWWILKNKNT